MYWCWIDFYWCFCDIISSRSSKDISLSFFNQIDHPNVLIQTNIVSKNDEIYKIFEKYGIEVNEIKIDKNLDLMTFDTNNRWIDHKNKLFQDLMSIDASNESIYSLIDKGTMRIILMM